MYDYAQYPAWIKSHNLALKFYKTTAAFPREELNGIVVDIRRASAAVPTQIAAACGRGRNADVADQFEKAIDEASKLDYLLLLSRDLNMVGSFDYDILHHEVLNIKRMLTAAIGELRGAK